jgi:hypothetical protein
MPIRINTHRWENGFGWLSKLSFGKDEERGLQLI